MAKAENGVSNATLSRLPFYLRCLERKSAEGVEYISSASLAEELGLSAIGVRKDLSSVAERAGKPKLGFEVNVLIEEIRKFLGYKQHTKAIIIGAGGLGRAILAYEGFEKYGISVVAAFDNSPSKIGAVGGKPVYPMERLEEIVSRGRAEAGILTVPASAAQEACDRLVLAGIRAILSFAPVKLNVPEGVKIMYEDLAISLAALCGGVAASE